MGFNMKATRFIVEIESNGGFDFNSLRKDYKKRCFV